MNNNANNIETPKISVALPVYNGDAYLREAIESILSQTYTNFEVVAIDDGSTDNTLSILQEYKLSDKRVRIMSQKNMGNIFTANEIIKYCRGDFIARMDHDDICMPTRFERQIEFLEKNPQIVCVGSRVLLIDADGRVIGPFNEGKDHFTADAENMKGNCSLCQPTVMMRKEAVIRAGMYREKYKNAEDIDLWLRLAELGEIFCMDDILLKYRQHLTSIGYSGRQEQVNSIKMAVGDAKKRRNIKDSSLTITNEVIAVTQIYKHHCKWAWWALNSGNINTSRVHAFKALKLSPFNIDVWKVLYCAIRGY